MNTAERIAAVLDRHLSTPTPMVVFGSAALLLDPKLQSFVGGRGTDDVDVIIPAEREMEVDSDIAFWAAVEATNRELQADGLYLSHIFAERQVVLAQNWKTRLCLLPCAFRFLALARPSLLDLIVTKMGRGDLKDLSDVAAMVRLEHQVSGSLITGANVAAAASTAIVPETYQETFRTAKDRVLSVVDKTVREIVDR